MINTNKIINQQFFKVKLQVKKYKKNWLIEVKEFIYLISSVANKIASIQQPGSNLSENNQQMSQEYDNQNVQTKESNDNQNYCLYGKKIWISEKSDFVEAFVFVQGEFIADILYPSSTNQKCIEQYLIQSPLKYDFGNLYIFPGLVDINVSLHIGSDWEEIEQTTELFMKGGITTIACQPIITNEEYLRDELASIKNKKERMMNKSSVDFCFLANLYPQNIYQLEDIYREPGVAGFKIYLTTPFQNGAGWVETKKDLDKIMKSINELRIKLENDQNSPILEGKSFQKQMFITQKSLLVTFHSIKSGDKELTITSPLRQRKIEERCDRTTYIKRTQGDSVLGETHKSLQNLEINFDCDDQNDHLTMGQISQCINDNILNLKESNRDDTSDDDQDMENNQSDLINPENEEKDSKKPFKEKNQQQNNQFVEQPQMSSYSNREDIIKKYAKATISSSENHQIKLIARAEMQTYNSRDDNENNNDLESENSFSSESDQNSENDDGNGQQKQNKSKENTVNNEQNKNNQEENTLFHLENERFDKISTSFSPISSPSSNKYDSISPNSEVQYKEDRKENQESFEERRLQEKEQFQSPHQIQQDQATNLNEIDGEKSQGKFIKVQKVQKDDSNNNQIKDEDKIGSLHKIQENDDSGRDSNSDQDDDNSVNYSSNNIQYHKKSCTYQSERSGSGLLSYKTHSLLGQNSKRGSHDIPNIQYSENGLHINLIKDMKRGSCDKDPPSYLNDNSHQFKKSSFNINKKISSMVDINKKEGQGSAFIPLNASKMKLSDKRKSMNLIVQVENNKYSRSPESGMIKKQNAQGYNGLNDSRDELHSLSFRSSGFLGEETTSLKDIQKKNSIFHPDSCFINQIQSSKQLSLYKHSHDYNIKSTNFLEKNEKDDSQDYQLSLNTAQEDFSARKLSIDSGSNHSIGNNILNQSQTSIVGVTNSPQINSLNKNKDLSQCKNCNENCNCPNNNLNQQNKSKFNQDYLTFLAFRPPYWEYFGIWTIRDSLEKNSNSSKVKLKVVFSNIGNSNSMYRITNLKKDLKKKKPNIHIYSETTGAYLYFSSNKIKNGQTIFKCEPPIGVRENKEFLINASKLNMVDVVSSYHFPVDERFKCIEDGDFRKAFSGICTAGFTLQATWTSLYNSYKNKRNKSLSIQKEQLNENQKTQVLLKYLVNMLCIKPAKILNIHHMKGSIQKGKLADFVIWDPFSSSQKIKIPSSYRFKSVHIFDQKKVYGQVHATIIRGKVVYDNRQNTPITIKGSGKLICRNGVI